VLGFFQCLVILFIEFTLPELRDITAINIVDLLNWWRLPKAWYGVGFSKELCLALLHCWKFGDFGLRK
jgi:hypothetical protein